MFVLGVMARLKYCTVQHGHRTARHGRVWCDMVRYGMVHYGIVRYGAGCHFASLRQQAFCSSSEEECGPLSAAGRVARKVKGSQEQHLPIGAKKIAQEGQKGGCRRGPQTKVRCRATQVRAYDHRA